MKTIQKYIRTSARKLRLVADAVRVLSPEQALLHLKFTNKTAAEPMYKAIHAAVANAKEQKGLSVTSLAFKTIDVQEGPTYKRFRAVSRGMAHSIMKRTAHILVELEEVTRGAKS